MGNEKVEFHPNGNIQALIDSGATGEEIKAALELWGSDAGVFAPADKGSGISGIIVKGETGNDEK